jgi:hypothetical protein
MRTARLLVCPIDSVNSGILPAASEMAESYSTGGGTAPRKFGGSTEVPLDCRSLRAR